MRRRRRGIHGRFVEGGCAVRGGGNEAESPAGGSRGEDET